MKNTIAKYTRSPFKSKTNGDDARPTSSGLEDDINKVEALLHAESLPIDEILFEDLEAADTLIVQTRNSTYTFSVTDAADRLGRLTGGAIEPLVVDARLLKVGSGKLKVGSTAVFLIESSSGIKRLSTSPITLLSYVKGPGR